MTKNQLTGEVYELLYKVYGDCRCPLEHESAFQLLAAVMLSAQCRDERVNMVTKELFAVAPDAEKMAALEQSEIEKIIHPCGLSVAKSGNLKNAARRIVEVFSGKVPKTMEELVTLPGIGRKSANVILGNWFGIPGFPVDTHVHRLANRIGLSASDSPEKIECEICSRIAPEKWTNFSHLLIQHGRKCCSARNPRCAECVLSDRCAFCKKQRGKK